MIRSKSWKKKLSGILAAAMVVSAFSGTPVYASQEVGISDVQVTDEAAVEIPISPVEEIGAAENEADAEAYVDETTDTPVAEAEGTKISYAGFVKSYGNGTASIVSGIYTDDASYENGYLIAGEEAIVKAEPDEGWELDTTGAAYFNKDFASSSLTLTPVEGQANQYKFTVPDDVYAGMLYIFYSFSPVLGEGEYEVRPTAPISYGGKWEVTADRYTAKAGEKVTVTIKNVSGNTSYGTLTVTDADGNEVACTRESIVTNKTPATTVYSFIMPASKATAQWNTATACNYTIIEEGGPTGHAVITSTVTSVSTTVRMQADNEIDGKYYIHEITSKGTLGSEDESTAAFSSAANGVSSYTVEPVYAAEAVITVKYIEATPHTITSTDITGAKLTMDHTGQAAEGEKVTMTLSVSTSEGYYYDQETLPAVTDEAGNSVAVTAEGTPSASGATFSFTMPTSDIKVEMPQDAIGQYESHAISIAEDSKDYISANMTEAKSGNSVTLTYNNTDGTVYGIKVQYEEQKPDYLIVQKASGTTKITMRNAPVEISVLRSEDNWLMEGNYDAELYNSAASTWNISDGADLAAFAKKAQDDPTYFDGKTINITKDIDLSAHEWIPVPLGTTSARDDVININGNGKTISGVWIKNVVRQSMGLFSSVNMRAVIKNLALEGSLDFHVLNTAYCQAGTFFGNISSSVADITLDQCRVKFTINVDGRCNYSSSYVDSSIGDFGVINGPAKYITNCYSENTIAIDNIQVPTLYYQGLSRYLKDGDVINNNAVNSTVTVGENVTILSSASLCGLVNNMSLDGDVQVENNYFGGTITSAVDADIYGITSAINPEFTQTNYSYFAPAAPEGADEDYFCMVDSSTHKVGKVKLVTFLNEWVSEKQGYLEWTTDAETGKPVQQESAAQTENFAINTEVVGGEYGEISVDSEAAAGKLVTVYTTPKDLCTVKEVKAVLASDETTTVSVKNNGDGTYSFYMPGGDVKIIAVFEKVAKEIAVEQTGEGTVTIKASSTNTEGMANPGDTVTVTAVPDKDKFYSDAAVSVENADGTAIAAEQTSDTTWTFVMPENNVKVNVVFKDNSGIFNADGTLKDGDYNLPVAMKNSSNHNVDSMAASCVVGATLHVENGKSTVTMNVKAVTTMGLTAWAQNWKLFMANSCKSGTETTEPQTHKTEEGNVDQVIFDLPGTNTDGAYQWGGVYLGMFVDAMGMNVEGWFAMDFAKATLIGQEPAKVSLGTAGVELSAGSYTVPISLKNATSHDKNSGAAACFPSTATLNVGEDGTVTLTSLLNEVNFGAIRDRAYDWKVYQDNSTSSDKVDAEVVSSVEYTDSNGKTKTVPAEITITIPAAMMAQDGVYVSMFVDAMGTAPDAWLAIDYANAAEQGEEVTYTGSSHVIQFGEYDVNVVVYVGADGKITGVEVTGENFGGTYADTNREKLQAAIDGVAAQMAGKSSSSVDDIYGVDAVSGATYSSHAIRDAVMDALGLKAPEENIKVPSSLEAGTYTVDIAYYSDIVKHSLVEDETKTATLTVDKDGNATLTTDIVNGTEKEPLYVLGFNGYYTDNDTSKALKTDAEVTTEASSYSDKYFAEGTNVVTGVSFPLEGELSVIYNTNMKLYVPAMNNLNDEQSGIVFENGKFDVDCFAKIYWNTLKKISSGEEPAVKDGVYQVPVKILREASDDESMMNSALCEPYATVTVKDGKASYALAFKPVPVASINGHLMKLWVFESDVDSAKTETSVVDYYTDGDNSYPKTFTFDRVETGEDEIYIRVSVDAMEGFDQNARLIFNWDEAEKVEVVPTPDPDVTEAKNNLKEAISEANALKQADYTEASWAALKSVLNDANKILGNADATKEELEAAIESVKAAVSALDKKPAPTPTPDSKHKSHKGETFVVGNLKYKVTKDDETGREVRVTSLRKKVSTLTIPKAVTNTQWKETFKVTSIKAKAFKGQKIKKAVIGANVTKIGPNAFLNCKKLTAVTIGKNVKNIGVRAFYGCSNLKKVTVKSKVLKTVKKNAFKKISKKAVIKVPSAKKKAYRKILKGRLAKGVTVK